MSNWKKVSLVAVVLALVLVLGSCATAGPSTADFTALKNSVTKVQNDLATLQSSVNSLPNSSSISSSVASATKDLTTRVSTLEGSVSSLSSSGSSVSSIQSTVNSLSSQISTISKQITDLQSQVAADATDIAALKKTSTTTTATTSSTTTTTTPATGVTVSLVRNVFTGKTVLDFDNFVQAGSVTQSFTYIIGNNTAKTLTSLSLALGLESLGTNGSWVPFPAGVTVTLTSGDISFVWTSQSTGLNYLLGWTSATSNTGFLGQLNSFSQDPGNTSYTVTVTVTFTPTATILTAPAITLVPIMQVTDYSPK